MKLLIRIAWRNIWRQSRRTWITIWAMALGVALSMACVAWIDGMFKDGFDMLVGETIGHVQVHHPEYPKKRALYETIDDGAATVQKLAVLPDAKAVSGRVFGFSLLAAREEAAGAQLIGIIPADEAAATSVHEKVQPGGRWLSAEAKKEIMLGSGLAETLKSKVGDEIVAVTQAADGSMGNELFTVAGIIKTGSVVRDRSGAYLHQADLQELLVLEDQLHEISLLAKEDEGIPALAASVAAALEGSELLSRTWGEINPMMKTMISFQDMFLFIMLLLVFSVAALGILNTMLMSVFERTKELGVIRALGLKPRQMVLLVVLESTALAAVASVVGVALGLVLDAYLVFVGLDFSSMMGSFTFAGLSFNPMMYGYVRPESVVALVVGLFLITVLASLWPAIRAARLKPVDAMRQEG